MKSLVILLTIVTSSEGDHENCSRVSHRLVFHLVLVTSNLQMNALLLAFLFTRSVLISVLRVNRAHSNVMPL